LIGLAGRDPQQRQFLEYRDRCEGRHPDLQLESTSPLPTPSQKKNIAHILQAGWHLLELINEVLDLAVVESGTMSISPRTGVAGRSHVRMPGHDGAAGAAAWHPDHVSRV